jgi:Cys-tRNA(Pro)/Cys-tRNA(Cys) deacylase
MSPLVRQFLETHGVAFSVVEHRPFISFEEAREILALDPARMVKGLTFGLPDGLAIVALRAGDRADYKRIADALGMRRADLKLAAPEEVLTSLDMEAGGMVPLPINGARVLVDRQVLALDEIICGSGRNTATLVIPADAWLSIAAAEVGDFSRQA